MYGKPMRVQSGRQGFTPSKFSPMGAILMPGAAMVAPGPSAPIGTQLAPAPVILQPTQPVFVTEAAPTAGMSDDTKAILGVGAALVLLAIGAAL